MHWCRICQRAVPLPQTRNSMRSLATWPGHSPAARPRCDKFPFIFLDFFCAILPLATVPFGRYSRLSLLGRCFLEASLEGKQMLKIPNKNDSSKKVVDSPIVGEVDW